MLPYYSKTINHTASSQEDSSGSCGTDTTLAASQSKWTAPKGLFRDGQTVGLLITIFQSTVRRRKMRADLSHSGVADSAMEGPSYCFSNRTVWIWAGRELLFGNLLFGIVVKASASKAEDPGFSSRLRHGGGGGGGGDGSGSSHTSDLNIDTTLSGSWRYRVGSETGWPGVSILWLGEVESWICNFCLSVAARKLVWADPSLRYASICCWDVKQPTDICLAIPSCLPLKSDYFFYFLVFFFFFFFSPVG